MSCTRLGGNCNLYKTCLSPCTQGRGNKKADIMLVGEANGENEDKQATPFVGLSGSFLSRHILRGTGLDESDLFITNAVKCRPQQNKKPNINNVRACRPYLEEEIKRVQPKAILLLGNVALHSLVNIYHSKPGQDEKKSSGLSGISQWRGIPLWSREFSCWLIPTYHPAALLRDRQEGIEYRIDQVISDFELAAKLVGDKKEKNYPKSYICNSSEKAVQFLDKLLSLPKIAFDIESEDLDPTKSDLLGISFSDTPDRGVYIPNEIIEKNKEIKNKIFKLMTSTKVLKVLHNGAFDIGYLRYKKYPRMVNWRDTMQEASLLDENFTKGLKPLVWRYLTFGGYDKELDQYRVANKLKTYKGIPQAILGKYAGFDTAATYQLDDLFYPKLEQEGLLPIFEKILMPVRQVMCDAEYNGFAVDKERAHELNLLCDKAVDKLKVRAYEIVGEEFNLRSPPQLAKILYQKMKLKPLKKSKKSESYSCDKASLEYCSSQKRGEIAQVIIDIKYIQSQQSKFINLILKHAREDGRVHTHYNLTGTVTGRTSCSDPGIHNIPRDRLIRSMFKASTGRVLVEADVKSAELRCLAVYSKEKFLINAFNEGRDLHTETYNIMYNKPKDYKPTDDQRFISKSINFGLIYGRGVKSLAALLKVSEEEAQRLIDLYFEKMPNVKKFLLQNIKDAHKNKYVRSVFGRKRRLPLISSDDFSISSKCERQANNSIIQSTAADYTYVILGRVARAIEKQGLDSKIILTVHDSIVVDSPVYEAEKIKSIIVRAYEAPVNVLPIKMEMDVDIESRWGEKKGSLLEEVLIKAGVIKAKPKKVDIEIEDTFISCVEEENDEEVIL
jgi:DNA polymerase I